MATSAPPRPAADSAPNTGWKPELHDVPLDAIDVGGNVRAAVDGLDELAASVRANGVLSPIRVAAIGAGRYELVYGQRRLAAAREAGLATIPAIVDAEQPDRRDRTVDQLVENLQRADLNALDAAKAYRSLLDAGLTQRQLAERVGVSQPTIANTLALLRAPEAIQERVAAGELTRSHVEAIAKLPKAEQAEVARRAVEHGLSTRQVEAEIERAAERQRERDEQRDRTKNRAATLFDEWTALLAKKKADPETTTLVGWAGIPAEGLAMLAVVGWQRSQTASRGADQAWRAPAPKGFCDCDAFELSYNANWMSGREVYKATLRPACIVKQHQAAADKAERDARDAAQAEQREAERKAAEERNAALAPFIAAVTPALPPAKAKLILFAMVGGDAEGNGYWRASRWARERTGAESLPYGHWQDHLWAAVDALEHERLLSEIARCVADVAVGLGGKAHAAIEQLVADEPKPDRPPKPPKPPKAREQG